MPSEPRLNSPASWTSSSYLPDPEHCDLCRLAHDYERRVRYWYHLTFIYGALALVFAGCCLWVAWGCW